MRFTLSRDLACSPELALTWVSDAAHMNRWSEARIVPVRDGDGGHAAGVGARRDVHLPFGRTVLREVVVEHAPGRFGYRVVGGAPVRSHRGRIEVTPIRGGARLAWTVEVDVARPIEAALRRTLVPSLARSLDALADIAAQGEAVAPPPLRALEETEEAAAALPEARATLDAQEARLAARAEDDPRRWFEEVYALVTDELLRAVVDGEVNHPAWVLRLVPRFDGLYARALEADEPEAHWREALRKMQGAFASRRPLQAVGYCIFQGMRAHIDHDLPRALAAVHREHYAGRCDHVRFRGDYRALAPAFGRATERMMDRIPERWFDLRDRLARRVPSELRGLRRSKGYDLIKARNAAFENATSL